MRTTFEVMEAVKDGAPATDEELRYALHNVTLWHSLMQFDLAHACTEDPISDKTRRGLKRAWENWRTGMSVPLDKRLKGSSYEPGISREESDKRWGKSTGETIGKLLDAFKGMEE